MNPVLLFVHGWGFDAGFWKALQGLLADTESIAWDLGFFGQAARPAPPEDRHVIAVGHSFGVLWLLHTRPVPWQTLIAINGFSRFTQTPDFPKGVEPGIVARMAANLEKSPRKVVDDFRGRCGAPAAALAPDSEPLSQALDALRVWDCRPASVDLALCGVDDPVVPPAMSLACFAEPTISWHKGGHLLPLEDPEWCARHIRAVWEKAA